MFFLFLQKERNMAQPIIYLPCRHENLYSIPNTPQQKLVMGSYACNTSTGEAEKGGSLGVAGQSIWSYSPSF